MQPGKLNIERARMFNHTTDTYTASGPVPVVRGCFAYMFTNLGTTICRVNGMIVFPSLTPATDLGDSRTIAAHKDDLFYGNINVAFAAGAGSLIEIVQLYYILEE